MGATLNFASDSKAVILANRRQSLLVQMSSSDVDQALDAFDQLQRVEQALVNEVCYLLSQAGVSK